jgi:hypothetical protein
MAAALANFFPRQSKAYSAWARSRQRQSASAYNLCKRLQLSGF